ncbi:MULTISPECIES: DUF397 domain-containing protein [Streptomyces]|jgi:hypothetical protein|uniref:DUF397 domain-containing protein n=1 Tax=Streptomyces doudnae TaxID=3075536 RepID=A0ABD5ETK7_9ACTN|nr:MULTISPECIES: DUF397 domain-containing protein [unclassified Streptomyces]MDT0438041.1 DUF397 domain-containing protein [Streptomyces sp. DSM 41981]MYQ62888.1 DUF397 domain-containing protein [Streptomyces sp. SID4950]SCD46431.1 protein of unknown function [Streptomyces sp. SolWspMP-5a-2]
MSTSGLDWFKSSYSSAQGDSCVEVAVVSERTVRVRDSKDVSRPSLAVGRDRWAEFTAFVAGG